MMRIIQSILLYQCLSSSLAAHKCTRFHKSRSFGTASARLCIPFSKSPACQKRFFVFADFSLVNCVWLAHCIRLNFAKVYILFKKMWHDGQQKAANTNLLFVTWKKNDICLWIVVQYCCTFTNFFQQVHLYLFLKTKNSVAEGPQHSDDCSYGHLEKNWAGFFRLCTCRTWTFLKLFLGLHGCYANRE